MGKARLLIVEDDVDISNMLKIYFGGLGYDVDTAMRGSEALEKTRQVLPHLIVLDIMLPDIDGYEVCRRLRQSTHTRHIPVIFLTQRDERSDRLQGLELGADDYMTKPFSPKELVARVRAMLRRTTDLKASPNSIRFGDFLLESGRRTERRRGLELVDHGLPAGLGTDHRREVPLDVGVAVHVGPAVEKDFVFRPGGVYHIIAELIVVEHVAFYIVLERELYRVHGEYLHEPRKPGALRDDRSSHAGHLRRDNPEEER